MKDTIVIYHKNCMDGFGAAFACYMKFADTADYIACHYDKDLTIDNFTEKLGFGPVGKDIYIVDFSFSREILLFLKKYAKSVFVYDHHKTAQKDLEGLDFCVFDMSRSGCVITYQELFKDFPNLVTPELFFYIQDRDLWTWKLPKSKEVSACLAAEVNNFLDLEKYFVTWPIHKVDVISRGAAILIYQNKLIDSAVKNAAKMQFLEYKVPIVNCTNLVSEILGKLAIDNLFAIGWFYDHQRKLYQYSLRSDSKNPDSMDCSTIAKSFSGGGHKNAAGFTLDYLIS